MSRSETLRKPHKARKVARIGSLRIPPWWLDEFFDPLERFVEQIHTEGVVNASAAGVLVHLLPDGRLYYPVAEMWRMAEVFRLAQLRDASCPGSGLLIRVAGTRTWLSAIRSGRMRAALLAAGKDLSDTKGLAVSCATNNK